MQDSTEVETGPGVRSEYASECGVKVTGRPLLEWMMANSVGEKTRLPDDLAERYLLLTNLLMESGSSSFMVAGVLWESCSDEYMTYTRIPSLGTTLRYLYQDRHHCTHYSICFSLVCLYHVSGMKS